MKKYLLAMSALFMVLSLGAQPQKQDSQARTVKEGMENFRNTAKDRLQSEHVAYLTNELELTPEEAQVFWPVYNKAQAEQKEYFDKISETKKDLKEAVKGNKSEKEIEKALKEYNKVRGSQRNVFADYEGEFVKVLGVVKTAKLYLAEDSFRTRQIHKLGGKGQGPGDGGGMRPQGDRRPDDGKSGGKKSAARAE